MVFNIITMEIKCDYVSDNQMKNALKLSLKSLLSVWMNHKVPEDNH
jgi:hypothetical protein